MISQPNVIAIWPRTDRRDSGRRGAPHGNKVCHCSLRLITAALHLGILHFCLLDSAVIFTEYSIKIYFYYYFEEIAVFRGLYLDFIELVWKCLRFNWLGSS